MNDTLATVLEAIAWICAIGGGMGAVLCLVSGAVERLKAGAEDV